MEWGTLAAWLAFLAPRLNKRKEKSSVMGDIHEIITLTSPKSYRFSQQSLALQNIQIIVICQRTCDQIVEVFLRQLQLTANFIHDLVGQIAFPMRIMNPENLFATNGQPSVVVSRRANLERQLIEYSLDINFFHGSLSLSQEIPAIFQARFPDCSGVPLDLHTA